LICDTVKLGRKSLVLQCHGDSIQASTALQDMVTVFRLAQRYSRWWQHSG